MITDYDKGCRLTNICMRRVYDDDERLYWMVMLTPLRPKMGVRGQPQRILQIHLDWLLLRKARWPWKYFMSRNLILVDFRFHGTFLDTLGHLLAKWPFSPHLKQVISSRVLKRWGRPSPWCRQQWFHIVYVQLIPWDASCSCSGCKAWRSCPTRSPAGLSTPETEIAWLSRLKGP